MNTSNSIRIVEVSPRDGLQNESNHSLPTQLKVQLIERLARTGLTHIEAGSFVSEHKVPAMAHTDEVFRQLHRRPGVRYAALTPNLTGYQRAIRAGADEAAVFTAASQSFCQHNISCSIEESLARFRPVLDAARMQGIAVRAYVSTVVHCPYEGQIDPQQVARLSQRLIEMGCYEVSLGDTTGAGTAHQIRKMLEAVGQQVPVAQLAAHFHDTYGQALTNVYVALEAGLRVFDSSVAGLGGCPYAPGASGNLASEDLVYLLEGMGLDTGVNLTALAQTGHWISQQLQRPNTSCAGRALTGG